MKQVLSFLRQAFIATMTVCSSGSLVWADEPGAHVHGRAALEIAIDGAAVQINLNSPLDTVLGFERAPRNEKERQAVKAMALKFNQGDSLFVFTPAAQCRVASVNLTSPVLSPDLLTPASDSGKSMDGNTTKDGGAVKTAPADTHAELEATWHFQCAVPQALQGLDVRLFQLFPGLQRLDTAVAGPKGQSSAKLSPEATRLKW
jgi:hypothetical protein